MDPRDVGGALLTIARTAIGEQFGLCVCEAGRAEWLQRHAATFVTLRQSGRLRGCVGSLRATRALGTDVRENAIAAAFRDPRFAPLVARDFEAISVEVSLLSQDERIAADSEAAVIARLRPGVDGLILEYGGRLTTFLPQVWESFADAREFVAALKLKADLPVDFWNPAMIVSRYSVTKWEEAALVLIGA